MRIDFTYTSSPSNCFNVFEKPPRLNEKQHVSPIDAQKTIFNIALYNESLNYLKMLNHECFIVPLIKAVAPVNTDRPYPFHDRAQPVISCRWNFEHLRWESKPDTAPELILLFGPIPFWIALFLNSENTSCSVNHFKTMHTNYVLVFGFLNVSTFKRQNDVYSTHHISSNALCLHSVPNRLRKKMKCQLHRGQDTRTKRTDLLRDRMRMDVK